MWQRWKGWLVVFLSISMMTGFVMWYLLLNQRYIPLFLASTIIALGFVAAMLLLPKQRQRLIEEMLAYQAKGKEQGGRLYRYQKLAVAIITLMALIFPMATLLLPLQYVSYFVLIFLTVTLAAGSVLVAGLMKTARKLVLLFITIGVTVAVLRILTLRYFGI